MQAPAQAVENLRQQSSDQFDALREKVAAQARHLRAQLDELEDGAVYKARRAARATDLAVQSHPYRAIGIAAVVGLVVGVLLGRR
jgi:ElaB/YqjD/DUF883 family membrane-anchored ribosome-binding protein